MSDSSTNLWSWITGAIGIATVLPLFYAVAVAQLPLSKIKVLEETLLDTRALLESVIEKNLVNDARFIEQSRQQLTVMEERGEQLKLSACGAKTTLQQLRGMIFGLSLGIHRLYKAVHRLRADISETTSEAQERLQREVRARPLLNGDAERLSFSTSEAPSEYSRQSVDITDLCDPHKRLVEMSYIEHCVPAAFDQAGKAQSLLAQGMATSPRSRTFALS